MKLVGLAAYSIARWVVLVLSELWWRVEISGKANVPLQGGFLLCPVHRSNIDGPLTCIFSKRRMKYLAKKELFSVAPLGRLFISMGAIPVSRGTPDRQSLKACADVLENGDPLVLFPEGGRRDGPDVAEVQEGAAYLALRAGVPIVPVGIAGSERANPRGSMLFLPTKIRVVIGEPLVFEKPADGRVARSSIRQATETLKLRLQELSDAASVPKKERSAS